MSFPRSSGVLLHPTSLPGRYGIGDLGPSAFEFVDRLAAAGQRVWQVLPLGPTGYGDSPYQSFSVFAGNPLLISLDGLAAEGLLKPSDVGHGGDFIAGSVDYPRVIAHRREIWPHLLAQLDAVEPAVRDHFDRFCSSQARWLDDYALFMAVKDAHDQVAWTEWETDIAAHEPAAVARWSKRLAREVRIHKLTQFVFFTQWARLRAHCR